LEAGTYAVEWYDVNTREKVNPTDAVVESSHSKTSFKPPLKMAGPVLLYLKRRD